MIFRRKNRERYDALQNIRRYVIETSLSSFPDTQFKVYGLTGPETCHSVNIMHTNMSPYTMTQVSVVKNVDKARPVSIHFYWKGPHFPQEKADAIVKTFEAFFEEEKA